MKKRSVYNFILGFTLGGMLVASSCVAGSVVVNVQEGSLIQEISDDSSALFETTRDCLGEEYYKHYSQELNKLENARNNGLIDAISYKVNYDYINSNQFTEDYIKENHKETYENSIIPLKQSIENKKQTEQKMEKARDVLAAIGIAGATIGAYSSAMLYNAKKDAEKEL